MDWIGNVACGNPQPASGKTLPFRQPAHEFGLDSGQL